MPLYIQEDSKKLNKRQITLPDDVTNKLQRNANLYAKDKTSNGYKRLKALTDKDYNKRSNKKDLQHNDKTTVSFGDARRIVSDLENMPQTPNNKEFEMVGGYDTLYALKNGLKQARNSVKQVMPVPPVPKLDKSAAKLGDIPKPIKMGNANITIKEGYDDYEGNYDFLSDYYDKYGPEYVLRTFFENPNQKQTWGPLINPSEYKAALTEFTKFGAIERFPVNKIYQWMGIILRNSCRINANTLLIGHSEQSPLYYIEDFMSEKYPNFIGVDERRALLKFKITEKEFVELCKKINITESVGVHSDGQMDLFMNQDEVDEYDRKQPYIGLMPLINKFNEYHKKNYSDECVTINENGEITHCIEYIDFFDNLGLYDTMELPDGSGAFSDYGLEPLFRVIMEYNDNKTPEETLVIINKALDVYHRRGDLASAFIEGGSKSLTWISESIHKLGKRTIYLTENQILNLKLLKKH